MKGKPLRWLHGEVKTPPMSVEARREMGMLLRKLPAAVETVRSERAMKKMKSGWVEGSVKEFLDLSEADMEFIETRRALSRLLKQVREKQHLTQVQVAVRLRTSQSRVAKMEKADPTVSADLLLQSLFRLGLKRKELAEAI